ncbi:MAG: G1 family glutamic endopeptidase [bacterium]
MNKPYSPSPLKTRRRYRYLSKKINVFASVIIAVFSLFFYPHVASAASLPMSGNFTVLAQNTITTNGTPTNSTNTAGPDVSSNWAGYTASGNNRYSGVGASWIIPKTTNTDYSSNSTWIGIGGLSGEKNLIQIGTHTMTTATIEGKNTNKITYKAWYEILPSLPVTIPVTIHPGDSVMASIAQESLNQWTISFQNLTTNQGYKTSLYYASSMSSVEWIQESPLITGTNILVPLDNFGKLSFSNAWTINNGVRQNIQQVGARPMNMLNYAGQPLVNTSSLGADGSSFIITRTNAKSMPRLAVISKSISNSPKR